jgi:HSP20 family protein
MLTTRWSPVSLWNTFNREASQLWNGLMPEPAAWPALSGAYPPVNLWEDDDNLYAEAELPGMGLGDLEIFVTGGDQLTLQGERKPLQDPAVWHRRERGFGRFSRTVGLPVPVDADRVEARFEQGVLRVTLPKAEQARPRRIQVKAE